MLRCTQRRCAGALDHISRLSFSLQPKSCRFRPIMASLRNGTAPQWPYLSAIDPIRYPRREGSTSAEKAFIDGDVERVSIRMDPVRRSAHGAKRPLRCVNFDFAGFYRLDLTQTSP